MFKHTHTHICMYIYIYMCVPVLVYLRCDAGSMMPNEFQTKLALSNGGDASGSGGSTPGDAKGGAVKAKAKPKAKTSEPKAKSVPKTKTPEQEAKAVSLLEWWVWTCGIYQRDTMLFGDGVFGEYLIVWICDNIYIYIYILYCMYAVN